MSKLQLEDFVQYGQLFEVYGKLLSEDRQSIMSDYFNLNMTLAEIAKERNISRQAVLDATKKSCEKLAEYEKSLGILEKRNRITKLLKEIDFSKRQDEIKEKVERILKEL